MGPTPATAFTPEPTLLLPTAEEATSDVVQVKTGDYALLAYDLEKVKTENGLTTYHVAVAIQNTSDHVVIVPEVPASSAQVVTQDGVTFAAQLLRYTGLFTNEGGLHDLETGAYTMIPPCAAVVDEHDLGPVDQGYTTWGWLFSFEIPDQSVPTAVTMPGLPDVDLEHMADPNRLRFGVTCPGDAVPLVFNTGANVRVTISNARQTQDQHMRPILAFDVELKNLSSATKKRVVPVFGLVDPEGTEIQFSTWCDNPQGTGNLTYGFNDIGPGQLVEGEVCFELKPDSYYAWPVWEVVATLDPREEGLIVDETNRIIEVYGTQVAFDELRDGIEVEGKQVQWIGNWRIGWIEIREITGMGSRVKRNLGDVYYLAVAIYDYRDSGGISSDPYTGWATIRLP